MEIKGVVLAGGTGSRLKELTRITNKHLLPVGDYPMIWHPVNKLIQAGIKKIMVITGVEHAGHIISYLGSGSRFGCEFTYRVQDEAGGIAQAIGLAKNFVGPCKFVVILGDNYFSEDITPYIQDFEYQRDGARVILKHVTDPNRFGVVEFEDEDGDKIKSILEKPKFPPTDLAVIGIYMYPPDVFDIIKTLKPSARGELEVTDINNAYLEKGYLGYNIMPGFWTDAGTPESYKTANEYVRHL